MKPRRFVVLTIVFMGAAMVLNFALSAVLGLAGTFVAIPLCMIAGCEWGKYVLRRAGFYERQEGSDDGRS